MASRAHPPSPEGPPPVPALHVHLDVAGGVRADALVGALLAAGASKDAAAEALEGLLGPGILLLVDKQRVHGVTATRARIQLPGIDDTDALVAHAPAADRRRRARSFARDLRPRAALAPVAQAEAPPPGEEARASPGSGKRAARTGTERASGLLRRWAAGEAARPADLIVAVRQSELAPVTKALALRTCTTLVEAAARVRGDVDSAALDGPFCVRALAHIAATCALLDALSPSLVTASVLGIPARAALREGFVEEPGLMPSAWVLAVLEGAWIAEHDEATPPSDVVGAALVRTLASRFGARGLFSVLRQGVGVASAGSAPTPLFVRAVTGRAAPVGTRAGEARAAARVVVSGVVDVGADREALAAALVRAGADAVTAHDVHDLRSATGLAVEASGPASATDALVLALWRAGAERVTTSWVEVRAAGVEEMTVPLGRATTKAAVRVRVVRDNDGEVISLRCVPEDVREAARALRRPEEVVRAEALQAWAALVGEGDRGGRKDRQEGEDDDE